MSEATLDTLKALTPKDDNQRFLKLQCLSLEVATWPDTLADVCAEHGSLSKILLVM